MRSDLPRLALALLSLAAISQAAVTQVEITDRADLPVAGFERIGGKVHFAIDPKAEANQMIADIAIAPTNADGLVEFSSDFLVFRPKDVTRSNGSALLEIVNRGRSLMWSGFQPGAGGDMRGRDDFGDNFLLRQGFTLIWIGWQFDVAEREGSFKLYAPVIEAVNGAPVTGPVRTEVITNSTGTSTGLTYPVADAASATLTVRNLPYETRTLIPKSDWSFNADQTEINYPSGFEPGRIYEFIYTAKDPVVAGVGMAAVRDYISYVKRNGIGQPGDIHRAMAYGFSQSGRLLRNFLYDGFNADEQGNRVFEAVWAHGAGGGRGSFNHRFAQPGFTSGQFTGSYYPTELPPFTPAEILAKSNAQGVAPKLIITNGSHEYWGRAAALNHVSLDGTTDIAPPEGVRIYYVAGTQHSGGGQGGGQLDPRVQNMTNPMDWTFFMRGMLATANAWITNGTEPQPSRYPRISEGELVPLSRLAFPRLPNVTIPTVAYAPRALNYGPEFESKRVIAFEPAAAGEEFPVLIPQVDSDGNETSGVILPELAEPLATYMGWNLRSTEVGASDQLYSLIGSMVPLPRTRSAREDSSDPRRSIAERYTSGQDYASKVQAVARVLASDGFLLEIDVPQVVERARQSWMKYAAVPTAAAAAQ